MDTFVEYSTGKWTDEECQQFEEGCVEYGWGQWKAMTAVIPSRNMNQIKSHAQKFQLHRPERQVELHCKHETWKSRQKWLGVPAAEFLALKTSRRKAGSSKKKLDSRPPLKPLKVKPLKKTSVAKSWSKNAEKSKVKLTPKKTTPLARAVAPVSASSKMSNHVGGRLAIDTTKKTTGAGVDDMNNKRFPRDPPSRDPETDENDPFLASIMEDIDTLLDSDFSIFRFFDGASAVTSVDGHSTVASATEETKTTSFTSPHVSADENVTKRPSISAQREEGVHTESDEIEAIVASAETKSPAPCVSPGRSVGKDFARLSAALSPNKNNNFDHESSAPRRISDSSSASEVVDAMEYKVLNDVVVDDDDDEEEEETKFESFEKLCNVGDLLHPFPGTSNGKAEEGTIDVSSTCELLLSDIEKNGDFAASFDASNLRQTANADVSLYNEIMGRLVACPDVKNENEFIECSTGTTRTELDKFTLLRIRIAHEIDAKHRDVQWWKDSVANKHFQKSSLEHLIALIQVMLDVQEWRVISADRIGFLQSKFNVEDDILSIGQELKGVWERVDRSLARDQFRLFGEDGFERHLATATMVDALEQSCREAVISFAV